MQGQGITDETLLEVIENNYGSDPTETDFDRFFDWLQGVLPSGLLGGELDRIMSGMIGVIFPNIDWRNGRIFLPGIPGLPLPPSPTIIGTIQDILDGNVTVTEVLGGLGSDIWGEIIGAIEDPDRSSWRVSLQVLPTLERTYLRV
jgi:hypothetical protein